MSTIVDVAKAAGLSTATVSRALSAPEKVTAPTRERVMRAVAAVRYRPNMLARNLRSDQSHTVLVLVPGISNPFFADVTAGIEETARARGYSVFLCDTQGMSEREAHCARLLDSRLADGMLQLNPVAGPGTQDADARWPIVHACACEMTASPSVRIDNVGAAREMVAHLIERGHRDIAAIAGPGANPHVIERLFGYRAALAAAGIAFDAERVVPGDFTMASGAAAAKAVLGLARRPTAVFSVNDEMAVGAIQTFSMAGVRVPQDIAVAGFDGIAFAAFSTPPLTTIEQPAREMGARAAGLLIDRIRGVAVEAVAHVLPHRLVVRASTGA